MSIKSEMKARIDLIKPCDNTAGDEIRYMAEALEACLGSPAIVESLSRLYQNTMD